MAIYDIILNLVSGQNYLAEIAQGQNQPNFCYWNELADISQGRKFQINLILVNMLNKLETWVNFHSLYTVRIATSEVWHERSSLRSSPQRNQQHRRRSVDTLIEPVLHIVNVSYPSEIFYYSLSNNSQS